MGILGVFISPWVPYALLVIALLVITLIVLAVQARRRLWRLVLGASAPVVLIASCTGVVVANSSHAALVNVPAPAPASLTLALLASDGLTLAIDALSAQSGALRWQHPLDSAVNSFEIKGAADQDSLYLALGPTILALSASTGKERWRAPLNMLASSMLVTAPPPLADGMVYVSTYMGLSGGVIEALRTSDGSVAWGKTLADYHEDLQAHALAAGQGLLFVGSPTGNLSALRSSDGALIWTWHASSDEACQVIPTFAGGVVYVAGYKQIVALHADDGTLIWSHPLATPLSNYHLGIGVGGLYFEQVEQAPTGYPDSLDSLNAKTGQLQWKYLVVNAANSRAIEAGKLVFLPATATSMHYA